jgi:hypothetical protein
MPVVVNTELGSGLPTTRGFKPVEPQDVANGIVEALQTGRFEVFVPKTMSGMVRLNALMPRRAMEAMGRMLKGDQVLAHPDHVARAAYEARMEQTIALADEAGGEAGSPTEAPAVPAAPAAPEAPEAPTPAPEAAELEKEAV